MNKLVLNKVKSNSRGSIYSSIKGFDTLDKFVNSYHTINIKYGMFDITPRNMGRGSASLSVTFRDRHFVFSEADSFRQYNEGALKVGVYAGLKNYNSKEFFDLMSDNETADNKHLLNSYMDGNLGLYDLWALLVKSSRIRATSKLEEEISKYKPKYIGIVTARVVSNDEKYLFIVGVNPNTAEYVVNIQCLVRQSDKQNTAEIIENLLGFIDRLKKGHEIKNKPMKIVTI